MRETYKKEINGLRYLACADPAVEAQVRLLFDLVAKIPAEKVRDGFRVEMGFTVFTFEKKKKAFQIKAPEYLGDPFAETTEDLSLALYILYWQTLTLKTYRLDGARCRYFDKVAVAKGALEQPLISLQRFPELGEGASGWCVEALEQTEDGSFAAVPAEGYETVYAYELLKLRLDLVKVLLLPYDYMAFFNGQELVEILNEKDEGLIG